MSSAIAYNLDQPKILLSGNGLRVTRGQQKSAEFGLILANQIQFETCFCQTLESVNYKCKSKIDCTSAYMWSRSVS